MSVHILSTALLLALAAALLLAVRVNLIGDRKPSPAPFPTISTSAQAERIVVMPTAGGRLEVATARAREAFTRSDPRLFLDWIDLGTTVSEVRVDATYRYHVEMARAWPLRLVGKTCLVRAGAVRRRGGGRRAAVATPIGGTARGASGRREARYFHAGEMPGEGASARGSASGRTSI